jgi:hypothetical protein
MMGLAAWLVSSCGTTGMRFNVSLVTQLEIGSATKAEVRQLFGEPHQRIDVETWQVKRLHFGDESTDIIWRYAHGSGSVVLFKHRFLQVEFDRQGRVVDYHYSSSFSKDKTPEPKTEKDFDIFAVRQSLIPGKGTRQDVERVLGKDYRVILIRKPGVAERWHYGYSGISAGQGTNAGGRQVAVFCGKSIDIDFDAAGVIKHLRGESDFPEDYAPSK